MIHLSNTQLFKKPSQSFTAALTLIVITTAQNPTSLSIPI
jgi:hypothetical protein